MPWLDRHRILGLTYDFGLYNFQAHSGTFVRKEKLQPPFVTPAYRHSEGSST
jgi:hypothetical protein